MCLRVYLVTNEDIYIYIFIYMYIYMYIYIYEKHEKTNIEYQTQKINIYIRDKLWDAHHFTHMLLRYPTETIQITNYPVIYDNNNNWKLTVWESSEKSFIDHPTTSGLISQIARFTGPTWSPPGSCRSQMGPMLAPWTLLSGMCFQRWLHNATRRHLSCTCRP